MPNIGNQTMESDNLVIWDIRKTTTDKLEDMMNGYDSPWEIWKVTHTGGRDWVVIASAQFDSLEEKCDAFGVDSTRWL